MHDYPSDITREQFEIIRSDLEQEKNKQDQENTIYTMFSVPFCMS